ncbi:hypothetical protein RBWH47_06065 [Rhodopirellula baltica WH47]|uniref:Uncharacterized protein n=1 Tax=Rhodopirellula baltica WH47 TaxID=991778 RepID=F2AKH3_RHOBT|nr:hypothetical protein RBWH47_06065 [Rhodopirellula baltica WH47]
MRGSGLQQYVGEAFVLQASGRDKELRCPKDGRHLFEGNTIN